MNKKEKSLKRLKERIRKVVNVENRAVKVREKEYHREGLKHKKSQEYRNKWYKKHEAKAKKSAGIIWKWYKKFIISPMFQEIVNSINEVHLSRLSISRGITCQVPSGWGGEWEVTQFFTIDIRTRELFAHKVVKYGKSNKIDNVEDLLEYVEPPILIAVAEKITNNTIWDVVNIS